MDVGTGYFIEVRHSVWCVCSDLQLLVMLTASAVHMLCVAAPDSSVLSASGLNATMDAWK